MPPVASRPGERIERLFDPGSFHETGALAGRAGYGDDGDLAGFVPANTVVGQGRIRGRRAVVQGDDFTVRGGAADAAIWEKAVYAERLAHDLRLPLVRLVDGTGGGGSVKTLEQMGFSYVPRCLGSTWWCATSRRCRWWRARSARWRGLGAARVVCSHFSVIVEGSAQLFVAGPPVVAMAAMGETPDKEQLGGARLQARAGAVDNVARDEDDALDQLKRFLSYLPANDCSCAGSAQSHRIGLVSRGSIISSTLNRSLVRHDLKAQSGADCAPEEGGSANATRLGT